MNIHQLSADSKMGCKGWKVVLQCVTNAFPKPDCNCITQYITPMVEAMTKTMEKNFLVGDAALPRNLNNLLRGS